MIMGQGERGDARVLVVVLNNRADWERVRAEQWYRIPLKHAPPSIAANYLAFYHTGHFRAEAHTVTYYAPIAACHLRQRHELLPDQPDHPRADEWYWRVALGAVECLPRPIPSRRLRRLTFIPTSWELLHTAHDVAELWHVDEWTPVVWHVFPDAALKATRRLTLEEQRAAYAVGQENAHPFG